MSDIESRYHTNLLETASKNCRQQTNWAELGDYIPFQKNTVKAHIGYTAKKIYTTSKYMISVFTKTHSLISVFHKAAWEFVTMSPYLEKKSLLIAA